MGSTAIADRDKMVRSHERTSGKPSDVSGLLLTENKTLISRPSPFLQGLSQREKEKVLKRGTVKLLRRGALLFRQGGRHDGIYLIEAGVIRVFYTSPSGKQITLAYWSRGNFVGDPDVFGTGPHMWSAIAADSSEVIMLPGHGLRQLIAEIPALAIGIIEALVFKGKCCSALAHMLGTRSAIERLAHVLGQLAEIHGVPDQQGTLIAASYTHAELAQLVGVTRQWVTVSLKGLQDRGILTSKKGRIHITNHRDLLALQMQKHRR